MQKDYQRLERPLKKLSICNKVGTQTVIRQEEYCVCQHSIEGEHSVCFKECCDKLTWTGS